MAQRERESQERLDGLARATDELVPTDDFVDAVMAKLQPADATDVLAKAARATADLEPADDFVDAVMRHVERRPPGRIESEPAWMSGVVRFSRIALMGAAAAAALSLWVSNAAQRSFDAAVLEVVASVEVDE